MGRGTTKMYDTNHKRCGNRPKASIWKSKGQWYHLGGCCWTGWKRLPITEPEAVTMLEALRKKIINNDHQEYNKAFWDEKLRPRIMRCTPSVVAHYARILGVAL